jgi:chromosome transmission fidelity protein 18
VFEYTSGSLSFSWLYTYFILQLHKQFIKARAETVTESIVRSATVGMKEAESSVLSVLNGLFAPIPKSKVKELGLTEEEEARYTGRLAHQIESSDQIAKVAMGIMFSCFDYLENENMKLMRFWYQLGCFAHYPNLQKHDATLKRYNKAMDWLLTHDAFSTAMYNAGEYALGPYLPFSLVAFFPLFQERGGPKVERDQADWEVCGFFFLGSSGYI